MALVYQNKDWLHEQHVVLGRTSAEIAREFNISPSTIKYWFMVYKFSTGHAMSIKTREACSRAHIGKHHSSDTLKKMSDSAKRTFSDPDQRSKIVRSRSGTKHDAVTIKKISESGRLAWSNPECYNSRIGENAPNWRGGISFSKYCRKFNKRFKEEVREAFNHSCYLCGAHENGRKLCIHHIDYNKNSICNGKRWAFVPLCDGCHTKTNYNRWYWFNLLINYWANAEEIKFP